MAVHEMNNPELMPSTDKDRDINIWDFTMLWAGMTINMGAFTMGAQLYPGLSPWTIIGAILAAYAIVTSILILAGDIGIRYGIPFTVYIRGCFGYKGAKIPAAFRAIPACFWFGFQTWVAAVAIGKVLEMWIGYSNTTILILIFGVLQVVERHLWHEGHGQVRLGGHSGPDHSDWPGDLLAAGNQQCQHWRCAGRALPGQRLLRVCGHGHCRYLDHHGPEQPGPDPQTGALPGSQQQKLCA
ncbi:cytosine permease [Oceanimonas sp. NS1]|nr:cytosine permease [Oceanimonas sp. NS1]